MNCIKDGTHFTINKSKLNNIYIGRKHIPILTIVR